MNEVGRLLLMIALVAVGLTTAGGVALWSMEETRRIRRGLKNVLQTDPHALLIATGRGKGVGFDFSTNRMAVAWDAGSWCLVYRVDELIGAELIVDGQVTARVHRGEARRALDAQGGGESQVRLRLVFDDAAWPDFDLDLWLAEDKARKGRMTSKQAVEEANRWLARTEAMLRRAPRRPAPSALSAPVAPPSSSPPKPAPMIDEPDEDDTPF